MSNWKLSLIASILLVILVEFGVVYGKYKDNPTLTYPLSPDDYEFGLKLVKERGKNDGKSSRSLRSIDDHTKTTEKSTDLANKNDIPKLRSDQKLDWERKWPNGTIPYILAKGFTKEEKAYMAYGFQEFAKYSCVRLAARINEESFLIIDKYPKDNYCGGEVGRQGGEQILSLALFCIKNTGDLEHELMHIFGFWHEQSRTDRNKYVRVLYENIRPKNKKEYDIVNATKNSNMKTKYDYLSLMHYGNNASSKNDRPTMKRKLGNPYGQLGQRKNFTKLDLEKIKRLYKCKGTKNDYFKKRNADFKSTKCEDTEPKNCGTWKQKNYCRRLKSLMFFYCKKTCDLCEKQTCIDFQPKNCQKWKKKNYCSKFRDYMIIFCAKTCRLCK